MGVRRSPRAWRVLLMRQGCIGYCRADLEPAMARSIVPSASARLTPHEFRGEEICRTRKRGNNDFVKNGSCASAAIGLISATRWGVAKR